MPGIYSIVCGMKHRSHNSALLRGLILLGLILFGIYLLYDKDLLAVALRGDSSYISYVIIAIWGVASARWLYLLHWVQRQYDTSSATFFQDLPVAEAVLARRLGHGWLAADSALKLGLLGTIVGFILMLRPLGEITAFDTSNLQIALTAMSAGMAVALYSTLSGLVCNILLRLQFQMLADAMQSLLLAQAPQEKETEK